MFLLFLFFFDIIVFMKRVFSGILLCCIICIAMSLAGCGNEFAEREYNDAETIVQIEDRYAKENSLFNPTDGGFTFTASKFDGRQTLWKKTLEENIETEVRIELSISNGCAKIVYIDSDNRITVIAECLQNQSIEQSVTKSVSFTSGLNRFKIVGYDCKNIDLKLFFDET